MNEVVNRMIQMNSVGRVRSALQWTLINLESVHGTPTFRVGESDVVEAAIRQ